MKYVYFLLLFLLLGCNNKGNLGNGFEINNLNSDSVKAIFYILPYGEVELISGPILELGYNQNFVCARNRAGYYFFSKDLVVNSKPPNKALVGPLTYEVYSKYGIDLDLPKLKRRIQPYSE